VIYILPFKRLLAFGAGKPFTGLIILVKISAEGHLSGITDPKGGGLLNVSFGFNAQIVKCLTTEKTEGTAESHRDHSVSSANSPRPLR